jgi:NAD(P)-dependent dehydrogenase (short-subunit alcohol dehydrogenase family)
MEYKMDILEKERIISGENSFGNLLTNKVSLITGGGSGIGRATAILFAQEGSTVIIASRNTMKGEETVNLINDIGGKAEFIKTDVSKKEDVQNLIDKIVDKYGKLDCAFNNAGIDGKKAKLIDLEPEEWDEIIDINLKGTFLLLKYEIKQMLCQGFGAIVNMASICSFIARPERCAYNASRHGVVGLTKTAALEYASKGIKINAVAPGSIRTDIFHRSTKNNKELEKLYANSHPIGRIGEPMEIAQAVLWLCSDRSSFMIGHTLQMDGGLLITK